VEPYELQDSFKDNIASKKNRGKSDTSEEKTNEFEKTKNETPEMKMAREIMDKEFRSIKAGWNKQLKAIDGEVDEIMDELSNPKKKKK